MESRSSITDPCSDVGLDSFFLDLLPYPGPRLPLMLVSLAFLLPSMLGA